MYGLNPVLELLRAHPERIEHLYLAAGQVPTSHAAEILSRARDAGVRTHRVPRERLATLAQGGLHQGVAAEVRQFEYAALEDLIAAARESGRPALVVVLDGIQDPQNLGAIVRSAHALGAHGVVLPKDRAASVTGAVAKVSAGAVEHTRIARVVNLSRALEELKAAGLWVLAAVPSAERPLWQLDLKGPLAIVVGAEGTGVREGVKKHCDLLGAIPMIGAVASMNAAASAAVVLYEVARQRALG